MSNMQAFHEWLFSAKETPDTHRRRMMQLTRLSRTQIMEIASDLLWFIWEADKAAGA